MFKEWEGYLHAMAIIGSWMMWWAEEDQVSAMILETIIAQLQQQHWAHAGKIREQKDETRINRGAIAREQNENHKLPMVNAHWTIGNHVTQLSSLASGAYLPRWNRKMTIPFFMRAIGNFRYV